MHVKLVIDTLDVATASHVIDLLLNHLKETQQKNATTVSMETGLSSLSKARRYVVYQQRKINNLRLNDILLTLLNHYQIAVFFDAEKDEYLFENSLINPVNDEQVKEYYHYYYYYFSHWNNSVHCATLTISGNFTRAQMIYYDSEGAPVYQSGKGRVWKTGATLFIYIPNSRPDHVSLVCLYIGNHRPLRELSWITGTYAGTRLRDDAPVCGVVLLHKINSTMSEIPENNVTKNDVPDSIKNLLTRKRLGVLPVIPFSEKDLEKIILDTE